MRTTQYTKEIAYDRETHDYAMYLGGELVGFERTYHGAEICLDQLVFELMSGALLAPASPPYAALLDAAGDPPIDEPPPVPPGQGGDDPERGPYSDEYLAEIDHLCRCADGEFILDWAMVDALEAHVRRALRDLPPAASPTSPVAPPLQPAPAGGDAANAAGLETCRVCGEMHAPPSEVCDVNGCGRGPVGVYWFGIPGRRYPARLCSAHGTVVMR